MPGVRQKDEPGGYAERVIINCLAYSDGSVWRRPGFRGRCVSVKRRETPALVRGLRAGAA